MLQSLPVSSIGFGDPFLNNAPFYFFLKLQPSVNLALPPVG